MLPISITPAATRGATTVKAHAQWLVCKDICVPEEGDFPLDLPVGSPRRRPRRRCSRRMTGWCRGLALAVGDRRDGTLFVQGPELSSATVVDAWFIPDPPGAIQDSAAQPLSVWQGGFTLALKPAKAFQAADGLSGILSVRDRSGLETDVMVRASPGRPPPPPAMRLQRMLGLAFLGGLILNLMPCVFPVLAMKAVALAGDTAWRARAAGRRLYRRRAGHVRRPGRGPAARARGGCGGGLGVSVPVPGVRRRDDVAAVRGRAEPVGRLPDRYRPDRRRARAWRRASGQLGSFFTGLLAVVVATPCTAPFMGVAIAAGLAGAASGDDAGVRGDGTGPGGAVRSCWPLCRRWRRLTPKPGRWMEVLKQALAFPMYGASAWLVWVISQEAGPAGVLGTAAGLVLLGFAAWVLGITQQATGPQPPDRAVGCRRCLAGSACGAVRHRRRPGGAADGAAEAGAEAFTPPGWRHCGPRDGRCSST